MGAHHQRWVVCPAWPIRAFAGLTVTRTVTRSGSHFEPQLNAPVRVRRRNLAQGLGEPPFQGFLGPSVGLRVLRPELLLRQAQPPQHA